MGGRGASRGSADHRSDLAESDRRPKRVGEAGGVPHHPGEWHRSGPSRPWKAWCSTALRNVRRVVGVTMDITERKEAEAAAEHSRNEELRFKDEFLSHVSHELRSPLTVVKQFTTILLGGLAGALNKEQHDYQQIVLKNVCQLQSMIGDILEVTRLETGKLGVDLESVSVATAVIDTINSFAVTARAKGVTLSSHVPPGPAVGPCRPDSSAADADHPGGECHQVHPGWRRGINSGAMVRRRSRIPACGRRLIPDAGSAPSSVTESSSASIKHRTPPRPAARDWAWACTSARNW